MTQKSEQPTYQTPTWVKILAGILLLILASVILLHLVTGNQLGAQLHGISDVQQTPVTTTSVGE